MGREVIGVELEAERYNHVVNDVAKQLKKCQF